MFFAMFVDNMDAFIVRVFYWINFVPTMLVVLHLEDTGAQLYSDMQNLYKNLTRDYQKEIVPLTDFSQQFVINFQIVPLVLNSFQETDEVMSVTMATNFIWNDSKLIWDPSLFGGATNITILTNDIWLPRIHLENSVEDMKPIGHDSEIYVVVRHNGQIDWTPGGILKAKCPTNILRFPFDSQECYFVFTMWGATDVRTVYVPMMPEGLMTYYTKNSNWDVVETKQSIKNGAISEFIFKMKIRRKPMYIVVVIILPTILFCLMNPLVFLLPVDSGERVSLGMTILLSYAIFLTIVAGSLPATSNPMCLLLFIMIMIMMVSGLIVVFIIINSYFHHKDNSSSEYIVHNGVNIAQRLDNICMIVSYALLVSSMIGYFVYIAATHD